MNLTEKQWSGVTGMVFFLGTIILVVGLSGGRWTIYVTGVLTLSPVVGLIAGILWWRLVEMSGTVTYVRGMLVGATTSIMSHILLTVILIPTGLLSIILAPISWFFILITGPVGVVLGTGVICLRKCAPEPRSEEGTTNRHCF